MTKLSVIMWVAVSGLAATGIVSSAFATAEVSDVMSNALDERDSLPAAIGSLWRFEGPTDLVRGGGRVDSGRINEIAIDPGNSQIMYATGPGGGLWKTTDGGVTWAARSKGWAVQTATAVALDPNNAKRVYVGTGDYKRLDHMEPFSVGIMRSLDGGLTWGQRGTAEMREYTVSRIVVDPTTSALGLGASQVILAATGRGSRLPGGQVFRSPDGGVTWASVGLPDANWDDLELDSDHIFWASATRRHDLLPPKDPPTDPAGANGLLYQSRNGGLTWTKVNLQIPGAGVVGFDLDNPSSRPDTILIACLPESLNDVNDTTLNTFGWVFVAVFENGTARVFGTHDAGQHWVEERAVANDYPVEVGDNAWAHAAFGVTLNYLYVGGVKMFRGEFDNLGPTGVLFGSYDPVPGAHTDFQCVVPDPSFRDGVFLSSDGGIYRYRPKFFFLPASTTSLNASLGVTQVHRMDVHPRHGGLIAIGAQDLGGIVSFSGTGNDAAALRKSPVWRNEMRDETGPATGDGRSAAFRQDSSSRVYLSNTRTDVTRYDGATGTALLSDGATTLQGNIVGPSQGPLLFKEDTLFLGDKDFWRLFNPEAKDLGTAFWRKSEFRPGGDRPAEMQSLALSLALCPANAQAIYAGSVAGELFSSEDGGLTWPHDIKGLPNLPIWAISPTSCGDVLVAVGYEGLDKIRHGDNDFAAGNRLFRKTDVLAAGEWKGLHGGPPSLPHAPLYAIARLPSAPDSKWFVAGDVGVFRTDDGGAHWANATAPLGLPNTLVRDLRLSGDGNTLYAATFGRGVWSMDVNPPANHFGVQGTVTQGGRPANGATVQVSGAGRIRKFLKNKLTSGTIVTTAPIEVTEIATISGATASVIATSAESVSLVTPSGAVGPMSFTRTVIGIGDEFSLTTKSAAALVGQPTAGNWRFKVTGRTVLKNGVSARLSPSVHSGLVSLEFLNAVSGRTGPDGEYTLEYFSRGSHVVSVPGFNCGPIVANCQFSIGLQANMTGLDFQLLDGGEFELNPTEATVAAHEPITYEFSWTVPEPQNWHDLKWLQLRIRDGDDTIISVLFDEASGTFVLLNQATGQPERGSLPGRPNRLETPQATLYLAETSVVGSGPTGPSVTLNLSLSFKPMAAGRTSIVEVAATDDLGNQDGFAHAGTLTVTPVK